jgi:UDP-N-acetylmuramate dehydrogenase
VSQENSRLGTSLRDAGFRGEILAEEPLSPLTTWRIGGPAELLASPEDRADLIRAVRWASASGVPWRILGNGSNLLVRDEGVRGLVIRTRKVLSRTSVTGARIEAEAGASFPAVANLAAGNGLAGIEFGAGIPGTIGGAVVMNAGWHEHEIGNVVESVEVLEIDGTVSVLSRDECDFGYRSSALRGRTAVVLSATLALRRDDAAAVTARLESFASSRKANQPTDLPSCGSVFLKPEGDFAGRLIEQAGLKGARVGALEVSPKHANFFVNLGGGTAHDALALVEKVEREVKAKFGVALTREFEVW